jgi:putative transposase
MAGARRRDLPDGFFHVTARGIDGSEVFLADLDRFDFLDVMGRVTARHGLRVIASSLMSTHYHLVVETSTEKLSMAMQQLNSAYARRFNKRHARRGHVFGERFSSWVIRNEAHLLAAIRYVEENPVKAGLCPSAADWPWTNVDLDRLRQ